jgi:hypothetical protein
MSNEVTVTFGEQGVEELIEVLKHCENELVNNLQWLERRRNWSEEKVAKYRDLTMKRKTIINGLILKLALARMGL